MLSLLVVDESLVQLFNYWNQGICQGMQFNNELYALVQSYPHTRRLDAYATAYEHAERGATICITVSKTYYRIWLNLRSLAAIVAPGRIDETYERIIESLSIVPRATSSC